MSQRFSPVLIIVIAISALFFTSCNGFFVDPTVTAITVTPASPSLVKGATQQFSAVATYSDGSTKVLSDAVWTTSSVATLLVNSTGLGTALSAGSATVSATSGAASGSTTVSIVDSPLTALNISPLNPSVSLGDRYPTVLSHGNFQRRNHS